MKKVLSIDHNIHSMKSVSIQNFSGPHFPAFGLNNERYSVSLSIYSECEKIRSRKTPNTDAFNTFDYIFFSLVRRKYSVDTILSLTFSNEKAKRIFTLWKLGSIK